MKKDKPILHFGLLILRVCASGGMLTHGWMKLQKLTAGGEISFPDPLGVGATSSLALTVLGEYFFPILIILGFKTRWAAVASAATMAVAFFVVHRTDAFADKELSFAYLVLFVTIAFVGAGNWSIDGMLARKRRR